MIAGVISKSLRTKSNKGERFQVLREVKHLCKDFSFAVKILKDFLVKERKKS